MALGVLSKVRWEDLGKVLGKVCVSIDRKGRKQTQKVDTKNARTDYQTQANAKVLIELQNLHRRFESARRLWNLPATVLSPSANTPSNGKDMDETILLGRGKELSRIPRQEWEESLLGAPQLIEARLAFMSDEHHAVRNYVVQALPRLRRPVPPDTISRAVGIPLERTLEILSELEERLFFLVRSQDGAVSWAFPVTAESTGHSLSFSTGERLDAA